MSYSIIFETKICKVANGDIIHFSLQGCNNDDVGRDRGDFTGTYYTAEEWEKEIQKWESVEKHDYFDLKIGSRYCQWADYGKHLRRMTKKAQTIEQLKVNRTVWGRVFDGITYYPEEGEPIDYPPGKEETDIVYGIWYGRIKGKYANRVHTVSTEEEIVKALKNKEHVNFYISKEYK